MSLPSSDAVADLRAFAETLADAAGAAILPYFRADAAVTNKQTGGFDPVTEADKAAERAMRALIADRFPDHGVLGEEFEPQPANSAFTWVLDPIDGTRQFIAGLPLWGVLIALAHEGRPILSVIDQPYLGERYRGFPGGAELRTRDGAVKALRVRGCASLADARISTTDPEAYFTPDETAAFARVRAKAQLTRYGYDCYAYAMLAAGGFDAVIEAGLAPWDVSALAPIVEGAGSFTDWRGRAIWDRPDFLQRETRVQTLACGDARVRGEALPLLANAAV